MAEALKRSIASVGINERRAGLELRVSSQYRAANVRPLIQLRLGLSGHRQYRCDTGCDLPFDARTQH
jgi:hypothetical protein